MEQFDVKVLALAAHFGVEPTEIAELSTNTFEVASKPGEYVVYTSDERDAAVSEAVDNYIDEVILPELPEAYRGYFNAEAFKRDVGFGGDEDGMISPYDGSVNEQQVDGAWYFIIRSN